MSIFEFKIKLTFQKFTRLQMRKILIICGPTATGKTKIALHLAKKFSGNILSGDSRQVYKGMDVVTGKDLPVNAKLQITNIKWDGKKIGYWETRDGVRIWLVDLVEPTESFSVSQWVNAAQKVIHNLWKEKELPIIVGSAGFYISALLDGIETINIPPDEKLRKKLKNKKAEELLGILRKVDYQRAARLNESDRKNPRRLVRAIETSLWQKGHKFPNRKKLKADVLMIGLIASRDVLQKRIDKRVEKRLKQGAVGEVKELLNSGVSWENESMTGTGYRQMKPYFEGKMSLDETERNWKIAEHQDAKKQFTWFKKDKRIRWFDITSPKWRTKVEKVVENWYNNSNSLARDIVTRS